jgi:tetratricopeptide (TPR) repeat protein
VHNPTAESVNRYIEWLSNGREAGNRNAARLSALPPSERERGLQDVPSDELFHTLDALVRYCSTTLLADASQAESLTALVTSHLHSVRVPAAATLALAILRGVAWTERANALRAIGDLPDAIAACNKALAVFSSEPVLDLEYEMARRLSAFIRHQMGESGEPLEMIRRGIPVFRAHGDVAGELRSRNFEGLIVFDHGLYAEAMAIFESALVLAEPIEDHTTLASLHNNIGHCAQLLGDSRKAMDHLIIALKLFDAYGLVAERPRALWGLAKISAGAGRTDEALAQLRGVAEELMQ